MPLAKQHEVGGQPAATSGVATVKSSAGTSWSGWDELLLGRSMPVPVQDQVFLAFLEAAIFEDEQLGLGMPIDSAKVARTAGFDLATARRCIERLVAEELGYVPQHQADGFYINQGSVKFAMRKHRRTVKNRPPTEQAATSYKIHISNSNVSALAVGNCSGAVSVQDEPRAANANFQNSDDEEDST